MAQYKIKVPNVFEGKEVGDVIEREHHAMVHHLEKGEVVEVKAGKDTGNPKDDKKDEKPEASARATESLAGKKYTVLVKHEFPRGTVREVGDELILNDDVAAKFKEGFIELAAPALEENKA